ncbi:MAG: DNA replication/repair protein RecF [Actinomycetota bacterium]
MEVVGEPGRASRVERLWCRDFRGLTETDLVLAPGLTVLHGENAQGKTSILEAVGWVARARSFRGVADALLVRHGAETAVVRAEITDGDRAQLFEAEIRVSGRNRLQCNRQPVARARDLHGLLRVTVFAPDDTELVKGGPAGRRTYLDELLASIAIRYDAAQADFDRVLRQRNALLRGGVRDAEARSTLDVFDLQLAAAAAEVVRGRLRLAERLAPAIGEGYDALAGAEAGIAATYEADWAPDGVGADDPIDELLAEALVRTRRAEIDRGLTLVGPHRDEWRLVIGGLDSRHQASQGEQRTLALALRLAGHRVVAEVTGAAPVLLLDDVFSELDSLRSAALVRELPTGQTLLTTAGAVPDAVVPERRLRVSAGCVEVLAG